MKLITLTGATAAGAESVLADIINNNPEVKLVIPVTTRPQLENEVNGKEFTFISKEEFLDLYSENKLVEVRAFNTPDGEEVYWGISTDSVDVESDNSYAALLSVQGANAFKEHLLSVETDKKPEVQTVLINRNGRDRIWDMLGSKPQLTDDEVSTICKIYLEEQLLFEKHVDFDLILKHNNDADHLRCVTILTGLL